MYKGQILVVDDEITIRTVLEKFLSRYFQVTTFDNGKEAMGWLESGSLPALMIVDVQMPEMNGDEFLSQVRQSAKLSKIPVFMLSGHEEEKEKLRMLELGANEFFVKPVHPSQLKDKIDYYLDISS